MGYIRYDNIGNITYYSDDYSNDSVELNNDALCAQIKLNPPNYKFINDEILYRPRPTPYDAWTGTEWVRSEALVLAAKEEMWEKIKVFRDKRKYAGVRVSVGGTYYWIHSDEASRIQHLGLAISSLMHVIRSILSITDFPAFPNDLKWKTMESNNFGEPVWLLMTWVVALQLFGADVILEGSCFAMAEWHRQHLMQSNDPYNYNYTTGWPEVYGG